MFFLSMLPFLIILFLILFSLGVGCAWVKYNFGTGYFVCACFLVMLSTGIFLATGVGDTFPLWMKVQHGIVISIGGGVTLFIPIYMVSRIKKGKDVIKAVAGSIFGAAIATPTVSFLAFATLFRGV